MFPKDTVQLLQGRGWRALCLALSLAIFLADPFTPVGYAHGTLYLLLLMMAAATRDNRFIMLMTGLSLILTVAGATLSLDQPALSILVANRATSVIEQLLFALLCMLVNRQFLTIRQTMQDLTASRALIESQRSQLDSALLQNERSRALQTGALFTFPQFANCIPHIIWTAEADGQIDFFNMAMVEYTGCRPDQLYPGNMWMNHVHPEDMPRCEEIRLRALREGSKWAMLFRLRRHDGSYRRHLAEALPLRDDNGHIYKWCGSVVDVQDICSN